MYTIVMLTENALTGHDVARLATLHDPEPVRVHVLVPVEGPHNRLVEAIDELALGRVGDAVSDSGVPSPDAAQLAARSAVDASVQALLEAGVDAQGTVTGQDPVAAVVAEARRVGADEVIVVTEPHLLETAFRRDWAARIEASLDLPLLHVVAGTDRVVG